MKFTKSMLKSNKGFTLQDAAIALMIFIVFAGVIGSAYVSIYKIQSETKVDAVATLLAVQIIERIDKLAYNEVIQSNLPSIITTMKNDFNIPNNFEINFEITPYGGDDLIKTVSLILSYEFFGTQKSIPIQRLKVKEL